MFFAGFGEFRDYLATDVQIAYEAGVRWLFFGLESGSQYLLEKSYNKYFDVNEAKNIIQECRKVGIKTTVSLIYPNPFESETTRDETLNWIKSALPDSVVINTPSVLYGSEWYNNPEKYGFSEEDCQLDFDYHTAFYLPYGLSTKQERHFKEINSLSEFVQKLGGDIPFCTDTYIACHDMIEDDKSLYDFSSEVQMLIYSGEINSLRELFMKINASICDE